MNQNLYRIVFNKKRGQLMAVAETASGQGKGASGETTAGSGKAAVQSSASALRSALHSILALAWGTALLVQPIANIAQAQIVANPAAPGGQRPTVLDTANGLPQVNIQTPSAAGVSRNAYSQFDVQRSGIILNNSRTNVQTQLGGFVQGNPWLATGSARVILNEVSSSSPSQLGGYVEVAGQRAEVIIANPAGINVNGGGFLNASSVTLTTGTAMLNSTNGGSLDGYRVQGGAISLTGAGLDAGTADYTNILARSFQANAGLWAKDLKVVTGTNDINAASLNSTPLVTPIAGSGQAPAFAVDIGQLGGMYAGKIMLIGSETGIGVNNAGFLGATAGNVMLQTNGWLTSSGVIQASAASANTSLQATGITNSGTLTAANILSVTTPGALDNSGGTINARRLDISAAALRNMGGTIEQTGSQALTLQGQNLSNAGGIIGALPVSANSPSGLSNGTTGVTTGGATTSSSGTTGNSSTTSAGSTGTGNAGSTNSPGASAPAAPVVLADGVLRVTGALNNDGGRISAAGSMDLASQNGLNNNAGTLSLRQLSVAGGDVNNQGGSLRTSGDMLLFTGSNRSSGQLNNQDGHLIADGQLQVNASGINNLRGEIVQTSASDTVITASASAPGRLDNTSGRIATNAQNLTLNAASIANTDGKIEHAGSGTLGINVANSGAFSGQRGQITSNGALLLTAGAVNLDNASTNAQSITLNASALSNRSGDIVASGPGASSITTTGAIDNSLGRIISNGSTAVTAQSLINQGGKLQATGASSLGIATAAAIDNSAGGQIAAGGSATLNAAALSNNQGRITAGTSLIAASGGLLSNNQGLMAANGNVTVSADSIDNTGGSMASAQSSASLSSAASTVNDGGRIQAAGAVALVNSGLSNAAGSIAGRTVSIQSNGQAVNNAQGTIAAVREVTLQTGALNNDQGLIKAGGALDINTGGQALTNTHAAGYANGAGGISTQGAMTLNTGPAGSLDNAAGFIGAKGALTANTASVSNINGGQIVGEAAVNWTSAGFDNRSGQLQALGDVRINAGAAGTLNNTGGLVRSAQTITLLGASVINSNTLGTNQGIEGGNNIVITASTIANDNGAIRADNSLTLSASGTVNNNAGLLSAGNTLTVQDPAASPTLALYNTGGTLIAEKNVVVSAATAGGDGRILSRGNLSLALTGGFVNSGEVTANRDASISAASVTNSGKLQAAGTLSITAGDIDNTATGEITATTTSLSATNSLSNRGLIDGVNTQINAGTLNNIGTGRIYGDTLSIAAATLNNDAETVGGVTAKGSIAARQQLDIGVGTLNNRDGALILSGGDMAIGGSLDAGRKATGSADAVNNAGSTIETLGKLGISAFLINNTNPGFAYDLASSTGPVAGDYITGAGNFSGADVGWVLGGQPFGRPDTEAIPTPEDKAG